jgi:diguanylate cyclase (GGDEF)-like protein
VQLPSGPGFLIVWRDVTVEHDRLAERERQSTTDPLTGLFNRRGAEAAAARERARSERSGTPLSLVVFDIDHFKRVNDNHGHAVGDEVLRAVAEALSAMARVTDVIARWGGEEFVAILPGGLEGARSYAERTRAAVADLTLPEPLTLSAGLAELGLGEPFEAALARADANLYQAKRAGRDRIVG